MQEIDTFHTCEIDIVLSSLGDLLVTVGEVVEVNEVVSIVVNDENVLNRLLRLLEKVMEPSRKKIRFNQYLNPKFVNKYFVTIES